MNVNGKSIEYTYKDNKLSQEKNYLLGTKSTKNYSFRGNISSDKKEILLSGGGSVVDETINYIYNGDFMKYYGSRPCMYDAMGNPTMYCGKNAKWKGRQLTEFDGNYFNYDGRGRRMRKNAINYVYDSDGRLIRQYKDESKITEPQTFIFYYDFEGVAAFKYTDKNNNGTMFFYLRDGQGNIIAIVDSTGSVVVQYYYDAWGNHKVVDENGDEITSSTHIGNLNPFRYRGYYYDTETGLYFLQTRYYDPEVGRFLNRDSVEYADPETINGLNLYAYCLNNPVEYVDPTGHIIISFLLAGAIVGFTVSFTSSVVSQAIMNNGQIDWGIAAIDGLFGAVSGALATTGIGAVVGSIIDAGLTFANEMIVIGMQNDWQYSRQDFGSAFISSLVTFALSSRISNMKIGFNDSLEFIKAKTAINKFNSKIARNAYKHGAKSIKTASKHVNNLILKSFTSKNALLSYVNSFILSFL